MSSIVETRYASPEMVELFSDTTKYNLWRELWVDLAEAECKLGVGVTEEQVQELRDHRFIGPEGLAKAEEIEKETRHDVAAHIKAYGQECPNAAGIIHLGATSCYVTDNADATRMRRGLEVLRARIIEILRDMEHLARKHRDTKCLAYTHYQVAQPTTVGKRVAMWMQDLLMDLEQLDSVSGGIRMLGCRGATGTGDSFLALFDGDVDKVQELEYRICSKYGKHKMKVFPVSGQTYTRKQDFQVLQVLSGIAQSASKFANDIRLLAHDGEITEDFAEGQVGSSAMPYKHNPMKCERICSLSRYVICGLQNAAMNTATQWLERTLDDSANRRVVIPDMFMVTDGILNLYSKVVNTMVIHEDVIYDRLTDNSRTVNTEHLLMECVKRGADRQEVHAAIKEWYSSDVSLYVHLPDNANMDMQDMLNILYEDPSSGMAPQQVDEFLDYLDWRLSEMLPDE